MTNLPDENNPYVEATNIIRDIQDTDWRDYDVDSVFELMIRAFLAGVAFEQRAIK